MKANVFCMIAFNTYNDVFVWLFVELILPSPYLYLDWGLLLPQLVADRQYDKRADLLISLNVECFGSLTNKVQ